MHRRKKTALDLPVGDRFQMFTDGIDAMDLSFPPLFLSSLHRSDRFVNAY
jgi:hypothetical protein